MANHPELYANVGAPHRHGWADETVTAFWYELINMIIWTRSLDDRIRRSGVRGDRDQGLLPSLAPSGLRDPVSGAYGQLVSGHLAEVRHLANWTEIWCHTLFLH